MKRRKTVNKYTIGENGQITNNSTRRMSNTTRSLLSFMALTEMFSDGGYNTESDPVTNDEFDGDVLNEITVSDDSIINDETPSVDES